MALRHSVAAAVTNAVVVTAAAVTPAGTNRFGIVKAGWFGVGDIVSVVWGGVDITANVIVNRVHDGSGRKRLCAFYYVNPPASAGDVVVGTQTNVPVANNAAFAAAITAANCGDVLQLAGGDYATAQTVAKVCTSTAPLTIEGAAAWATDFQATLTLSGSNIIVTGLDFDAANGRLRVTGDNNHFIANRVCCYGNTATSVAIFATTTGDHTELAYNEFFSPGAWRTPVEDFLNQSRIAIRTAEGGTGAVLSPIITWSATDPISAPAQVTGLQVAVVSSSQLNLSWSAVPGADTYTVRRGGSVIQTGVTATTFNNTGLTASTAYAYTVAGVNSAGEGTASASVSGTTQAASGTFNPDYPRLSAQQILFSAIAGSNYSETVIQDMSRYHLLTLGPWREWEGGGFNTATLPAHIKSYNPDIKIFWHINPTHLTTTNSALQWIEDKLAAEKGAGGVGDWWLRTGSGALISHWRSTTFRINETSFPTPDANGWRWPMWFARYIDAAPTEVGDWVAPLSNKGRGAKEGAWDGIMVDDQTVGYLGPQGDFDENGTTDKASDSATVREWIIQGRRNSRDAWATLHPTWLFLGNLSTLINWNEPTIADLGGIYDGGQCERETGEEVFKGWAEVMAAYRRGLAIAKSSKLVRMHNDMSQLQTQHPGLHSNFRWNRYWLASTLLDNGYYESTTTGGYSSLPWFEEFDGGALNQKGYLGQPIDPPQLNSWSLGVFRREFDNGLVLVNPKGNGTRTVTVGAGWKYISGTEDAAVNTGANINSPFTVTLEAQDARILLRQ